MANDGITELVTINHSMLIDGFAELQQHTEYVSFDTNCGICGIPLRATPDIQNTCLKSSVSLSRCYAADLFHTATNVYVDALESNR